MIVTNGLNVCLVGQRVRSIQRTRHLVPLARCRVK